MAAVNKDTVTRGLRYSIATGNWGMQGTAGMRAGVSQVCLWMPLTDCRMMMPHLESRVRSEGRGADILVTAANCGNLASLAFGFVSCAQHSTVQRRKAQILLLYRSQTKSMLCCRVTQPLVLGNAGAEPPNVRLNVVASATHQLSHRARGQAGQAAPAAQLTSAPLQAVPCTRAIGSPLTLQEKHVPLLGPLTPPRSTSSTTYLLLC